MQRASWVAKQLNGSSMIEEVYTMKMYYEEPDFDIIQFEVEDMITLSGTDFMGIDFEDLI